ncbi:Protein of unknown function (DUF1881) [Cylindrospermum stagnale PCC 7417]|uniref:Uncharacterized protein n=1 Tax=Cylindrospermum stagnale PCC 7417 TaxID=56107 RepID=K9X0K4_9NOST|nr:beta/gamma crystallin domain-containing protein [Cylindrospermum stagnale]AFZ25584.1 Protein of unknown function (DUF1881) [Cylindrospermum stagnale PCC 7417]
MDIHFKRKLSQLLCLATCVLSLVFFNGGRAYAAPSANEVAFFTATNFGGSEHTYNLGDKVDLYKTDPSLNDQFKSVKIGSSDIKVLAWQDDGFHGAFEEYREDTPSINIALTSFHVVTNGLSPSFKFFDATNSSSQYCLTVKAYEYGDVVDCSKDGEDVFQVIGTLDKNRPEPLTTAIYLRNQSTGSYETTGSIYFTYSADKTHVVVANDDEFPAGMTYEPVGNDQFIFKWNGLP